MRMYVNVYEEVACKQDPRILKWSGYDFSFLPHLKFEARLDRLLKLSALEYQFHNSLLHNYREDVVVLRPVRFKVK